MSKRRQRKMTDTDLDFQIEDFVAEPKEKRGFGIFVKIVIFLLIVGLIGQVGYLAFTYRNQIFRSTSTTPVQVETPKEKITLTPAEVKSEAAVKAVPTFTGNEEEAQVIVTDFATKYLTMSNLPTQLDYLGREHLYADTDVERTFKEYSLTNYYYYFPDMLAKYGKENMPEITAVEVLTSEEVSYTHSAVEKVEGYRFALSNTLEKNEEFMKKKFDGYHLTLDLTYKSTPKTSSWMKNAPAEMDITVLYDTVKRKWFISEFHLTGSQSDEVSETTVVDPKKIGRV